MQDVERSAIFLQSQSSYNHEYVLGKCLEHKLGKKTLEMQIDDAYSQSLSGIAQMEVDRFERLSAAIID